MNDPQLPDDLVDVERQLTRRTAAEPRGLRDRVLAEMRRELRRPAAGRGAGRFAAALAAAVLLWANFSMSAVLDTAWRLTAEPDTGTLMATASRTRQLVPEWSEREVYRHAILTRAAASLTPMPNARLSPSGLHSMGFVK